MKILIVLALFFGSIVEAKPDCGSVKKIKYNEATGFATLTLSNKPDKSDRYDIEVNGSVPLMNMARSVLGTAMVFCFDKKHGTEIEYSIEVKPSTND